MQLDQAQKDKVSAWIAEGKALSEIQKLLESEFQARLTYLEVRLLVDDLKLLPKDQQHAEAPKPVGAAPGTQPEGPSEGQEGMPTEEAPAPTGGVALTVDRVTRPGAVVSGSVTFSDGNKAGWYLDQMGRLGLMPQQQGYRPSQEDLQDFQMALQRELQSHM
jgi:hypothetical protein